MRWTRMFCGLAALLCLSCCNLPNFQPVADPTRFYVLSGGPTPGRESSPDPAEALSIGLRPVVLPDYLNTRKIAIRAETHEIRYRDFQRWGEDLQKAVTRELALKLAQRRASLFVEYQSLARPSRLAAILIVDIHRFEVDEQGVFQLQGEWRLQNPGTGEALAQESTFWSVPGWDQQDYTALVSLHETALSNLADDIVDALNARF